MSGFLSYPLKWVKSKKYVHCSTQLHSGLPTPLQKLVSLKMNVTLSNTLLQEKYECKFIEIRKIPLIHPKNNAFLNIQANLEFHNNLRK